MSDSVLTCPCTYSEETGLALAMTKHTADTAVLEGQDTAAAVGVAGSTLQKLGFPIQQDIREEEEHTLV